MGKPEAEVENYLVQQVNAIGGEIRKVQWVNHRGAPDRVVFYKGMVCFVECKAPGRKLQPHQKREHTKLKAQGVDVIVLDTIAAVGAFLRSIRVHAETT